MYAAMDGGTSGFFGVVLTGFGSGKNVPSGRRLGGVFGACRIGLKYRSTSLWIESGVFVLDISGNLSTTGKMFSVADEIGMDRLSAGTISLNDEDGLVGEKAE